MFVNTSVIITAGTLKNVEGFSTTIGVSYLVGNYQLFMMTCLSGKRQSVVLMSDQ